MESIGADSEDGVARFVQIGALCYPEQAYFEALNAAGFAHVERVVAAPTPRALLRGLRGLKTPGVAERVRREALARVAASVAGVPVSEVPGVVVAQFPAALLDKATGVV